MRESYDVIVVGAGVVGIATAQHLLMRGSKVLLIDKGAPGQETSYGNSGVIGTHYTLPFGVPPLSQIPNVLLNRLASVHIQYRYLPRNLAIIVQIFRQSLPERRVKNGRLLRPLTAAALVEHRAMMKNTDAEQYLVKTGNVKLYRSEASFAKGAFERRFSEEMGEGFDIMTPQAFAELEPDVKPNYYKIVRWQTGTRLSNPGAMMTCYAGRFTREGGTLMRAEVKALAQQPDKSWSVATDGKVIEARDVVICTGPWSGEFMKPLGYHFPLGLLRGYHRHFSAVGSAKLSHAMSDSDRGFLICPMEEGYRLTSGVEFAGLHAPKTPVQLEKILPSARELFPLGDPVEASPWVGCRPCFADARPVVGAAPRHAGLWFNFGHGYMGLTIGPASARLLAEMMKGEKPFCDPHPYRPERFAC